MINDFFGQTITVQPQVSSIDANGELVRTYPSSVQFTTKGRIESAAGNYVSGSEHLRNSKELYITPHKMFCPVISISNLDRVSLGTSTYEVKHITNRRERFLAIDLELATTT